MHNLHDCKRHATRFEELAWNIITKIQAEVGSAAVVIHTQYGAVYTLEHDQDCCEDVWLADIVGFLEDLIGIPVLLAEEIHDVEAPPHEENSESYTWTYYKLATIKGAVTFRFYGSSNGYYSEGATFKCTTPPNPE